MSRQVLPYKQSHESKSDQIEKMFDRIAGRYDFLNHFLSLGIDRYWRKKAVKMLIPFKPKTILDVATGTGDFAIAATECNPEQIKGIDISTQMLLQGKEKIMKMKLNELISLEKGSVEDLPFDNSSFDAVTVAFGVRNFNNFEKGLSEIKRVLHKGGQLVILEFSKPTLFPVNLLYHCYFHYLLPILGRLVSKEKAAYRYLPNSVAVFPEGPDLVTKIEGEGLIVYSRKILTAGICSIYLCVKQ